MGMKWVCDICGKDFDFKKDYDACMLAHKLEEKRKTLPKETVLCPICEGEGGYYGNDGCDWRTCSTCGGVGFVIPITETKTVYSKIK